MPLVESTSVFGVEALQPASPPVAVPYIGDDTGVATVGLYTPEVELAKQLDAESFIRLYKPLLLYVLDLANTQVHSLYQETRNPVYLTPILVPTYVQVEPPKRVLKKFGLETEHEAIALLSLAWLEKYAPTVKVKTGDRFGYYNDSYTTSHLQPGGLPPKDVTQEAVPRVPNFSFEVLTTKHADYWGNTQIPLHLLLTLKNLRAPGKPDTNITNR